MTDLAPFVPVLAVELGVTPGSHWTSVDGSMLSADISGFTALSERLAGKGKAGAEEITELINTCFTALIDSAYDFGGEVLKFGGDALLVLFRGDDHERRCANAAQAMQVALHASGAAKRANLTMTVGAAEGPFDVFLAGSGYRELLITGPRASEVIHLEGEADKGETLVSPAIAATLPDSMIGRSHAGGLAVAGETGDAATGPMARTIGGLQLEPFVPASVREQLGAFAGMGGEHRLVSVGFVMIGGVAAAIEQLGPDGTAQAFGRLVDDLIAATAPYGVTVLHTDIAPDGVKFVLCAGAPVNPGDIGDALLQAALEIAAVDSPFVIRQGVQTGRVFAGFLGSPYRRTYTLMGDPVNTAARMLGKADDRDIVAVGTVVEDTRTIFVTEELEPFHVKGKTDPIVAHKVLAGSDVARRGASATRLFGRQKELDTLGSAIGELGDIVVLTGPAGVGKSRLLDAAWDEAEGLSIYQGACTPYGAASPYSVFRPLLRGGSGIDIDADARTAGRELTERVREFAPDLAPMLPLLAVPFGAEVPPTPETRNIEPEFRRARIHDAVLDFLDATLTGPVFLVVEDLHWVDDASGELVNHLVRAAATRPWTGVFTRRPEGHWAIPDDITNITEIVVEALTDDHIRSLAIEVSSRALSDNELDVVVERADGNPLFAIELARAVGTGSTDALPDSIEGVISTRVDDLSPQARRVVRLASVFGREFDPNDVAALVDDSEPMNLAEVDGLVERVADDRYAFTHAMYRDVAYEGLPFRQRRTLHRRVAEYLETSVDEPRELAALLSTHYGEARSHEKAWIYSRLAGEEAQQSFANHEAAELFRRALRASRYVRSVTAEEKAEVWEHLGHALELSGQYEDAFDAYRRQKRYSTDLDTRVRATRRQARSRQRLKQLTAATRLLRSAERMLDGVQRDTWVHQRLAEIHLNLSGIRMDQGRQHDARVEGEIAEQHARDADDEALLVSAHGAIVGGLTDWNEAQRYVDSVDLAAEIGAYEAESMLAQNLGMIAFFAGEWDQAVRLYGRGGSAAARIGNVTIATAAEMNAAEVLVDQGRYDTAEKILENACRVFRAAGYESALLYAELNLGTALIRGSDLVRGQEMLRRCASGFRDGAMLLYAVEADLRLAESHLLVGETEQARGLLHATLAAAADLDRGAVIEVRAHRLLGVADLAGRRSDEAAAAFERAVDISRSGNLRFELALARLGWSEATGDQSGRDEADTILRELGVVSVPFHTWPGDLSTDPATTATSSSP